MMKANPTVAGFDAQSIEVMPMENPYWSNVSHEHLSGVVIDDRFWRSHCGNHVRQRPKKITVRLPG
ncbi:hypothetical protein [Lacticaseibacillus saniviri]